MFQKLILSVVFVAVVALRIVIGDHFVNAGTTKLQDESSVNGETVFGIDSTSKYLEQLTNVQVSLGADDQLGEIVEQKKTLDIKIRKLEGKINQEFKMADAAGNADSLSDSKTNSLHTQLTEVYDSAEILLAELNQLGPEDPKHLYGLAGTFLATSRLNKLLAVEDEPKEMLEVPQGQQQGLSIMRQIAPLDSPGFFAAHLFLAKFELSRPSKTAIDRNEKLRIANLHLDNALIRVPEDTTALGLKVLLAQESGRLDEAKLFLEKLFVKDPFVYPQLCKVNLQLGKGDENQSALLHAIERLSVQIPRMTGSSDRRTKYVTYLVDCYHRLEKIDAADSVVKKELALFPNNKIIGRWGERLLSIGQELRYRLNGPIAANNMAELVEYLREGHRLDPKNKQIIEHVVRLRSFDIPGLAEASEEIYQPGPKSPASVDSILGVHASTVGDYVEARKRFSTANQKSPNNAEYLNNLSWSYLRGPDPDPRVALKLVNKAIRIAQSGTEPKKYLTYLYDTKGQSLLALGRIAAENGDQELASSHYVEATAQLLLALIDRPQDLPISKLVLECYEANDQAEQVKAWTERVNQLEASQSK